ncbi:hypothetical protein [Mesobacillus jeotgali]|uniref:hypothetical protein n=1 Tax=Mesobacillus jeotgali TaxID=129985 RepID=UPI0009A86C05|nr:hypothetical protein [Mesobacillus jeotgali]
MTIDNMEKQLASKVGKSKMDIPYVWSVFKEFAKEELEGEEEKVILFQCGVFNFTGENRFYFDFVRQFTSEDGGTLQLHCEYVFEPDNQLKKIETSIWYFESDGDLEDYFAEIENLNEFKIPLNYMPSEMNLYLEEV